MQKWKLKIWVRNKKIWTIKFNVWNQRTEYKNKFLFLLLKEKTKIYF